MSINDKYICEKEQVRTLRTAVSKLNDELTKSYAMGLEVKMDVDFYVTESGKTGNMRSVLLNEAYYGYSNDFLLEIINEEWENEGFIREVT